jgi:hypothetical protein
METLQNLSGNIQARHNTPSSGQEENPAGGTFLADMRPTDA